jgi:hypothetical protein
MLSVGEESAFLTPEGPLAAGQLEPGRKVLGLLGGAPLFVEIAEVVRRRSSSETAYWVCTGCGDIVIDGGTEVVSGGGPVRGDYLWHGRNRETFGWMDGEWPALETYVRSDLHVHANGTRGSLLSATSKAALELASIGAREPVYRLGLHEDQLLFAFATAAIGREVLCERGSAGWLWLKPTGQQRPTGTHESQPQAPHSLLVALWQRGDGPDDFRLPVLFGRLRSLTMCLLAATGHGCATSYRPRYMPLFVDLRISGERAPHTSVQAVLERRNTSLVSLRLRRSGVYVVVNGLLCSDA